MADELLGTFEVEADTQDNPVGEALLAVNETDIQGNSLVGSFTINEEDMPKPDSPEKIKTIQTLETMPKEIPSLPNVRDLIPTTPWQYDLSGTFELLKDKIPIEHQEKAKNALSLAATLNIKPSEAFNFYDAYAEEYQKKYGDIPTYDKAIRNFKAGVGNTYSTLGHSLKWMDVNDTFADAYIDYGNRLRLAYVPPVNPGDVTWKSILEPDFWATHIATNLPFTLALIPASFLAFQGAAAGAGAAGFGTFGQWLFGSLVGGSTSRAMESTLEAGAMRETMLEKTGDEALSNERATQVFEDNLKLVGMDIGELALTFAPLRITGPAAKAVLAKRIAAATGKIVGVGFMEGPIEERYQEYAAMKAEGEDVSFFTPNKRLDEASLIGFVFGAGMGGVGSVWTEFYDRIVTTMPDKIKKTFEVNVDNNINAGLTEQQAELKALDELAATPEGKTYLDSTLNDLKAKAEGQEVGAKPVEEAIPSTEEETLVQQSSKEVVEGDIDLTTLTDEEIVNRILAEPAQIEEKAEAAPIETPKPIEITFENIPTDLIIDVTAIKAKTGERVKAKSDAREAFVENNAMLKKYQSLLDCLGA